MRPGVIILLGISLFFTQLIYSGHETFLARIQPKQAALEGARDFHDVFHDQVKS